MVELVLSFADTLHLRFAISPVGETVRLARAIANPCVFAAEPHLDWMRHHRLGLERLLRDHDLRALLVLLSGSRCDRPSFLTPNPAGACGRDRGRTRTDSENTVPASRERGKRLPRGRASRSCKRAAAALRRRRRHNRRAARGRMGGGRRTLMATTARPARTRCPSPLTAARPGWAGDALCRPGAAGQAARPATRGRDRRAGGARTLWWRPAADALGLRLAERQRFAGRKRADIDLSRPWRRHIVVGSSGTRRDTREADRAHEKRDPRRRRRADPHNGSRASPRSLPGHHRRPPPGPAPIRARHTRVSAGTCFTRARRSAIRSRQDRRPLQTARRPMHMAASAP
jgi:hypothetical protein